MTTRNVVVLVGSLRRESFSRKMARALIEVAPPSLALRFEEIGQLPLYNQDFDDEKAPPAPWVDFRERVRQADGLLFVTPEYNRSVPGVLKNAIDVGSRPYGQSAFAGKPGAVISVSPGQFGGFGANHHLRQSLVFLDVPVLQQPEMYLNNVAKRFDAEGKLTDQSTRELLEKFAATFATWIEQVAARPALGGLPPADGRPRPAAARG